MSNVHRRKEGSQVCQNCLKYGHFTFECKNTKSYNYRPSKTAMIKKNEYIEHYISKANEEEDNSISSSSESETSIDSQDESSSSSDISETHQELRRKLIEKYEAIKSKKEQLELKELKVDKLLEKEKEEKNKNDEKKKPDNKKNIDKKKSNERNNHLD